MDVSDEIGKVILSLEIEPQDRALYRRPRVDDDDDDDEDDDKLGKGMHNFFETCKKKKKNVMTKF